MKASVIYASRHGATAEIAERIARRMADRGIPADIRRIDAPGGLDDLT